MTAVSMLPKRVMRRAIHEADKALHRVGVDVARSPDRSWPVWLERVNTASRARVLASHPVDLVVDVGANTGQYGHGTRGLGYRGPILSFEPQQACLGPLRAAADRDGRWQVMPVALGAAPGTVRLNIAGNSGSSSLLPMLDTHREAAPESAYVGTEEVEVQRLDDAVRACRWPDARRIWLKIDTQGFEWEVIRGGPDTISKAIVVELELSFAPLYEGQMLFADVVATMVERGFVLHAMHEVFVHPTTLELLQVDGIFVRKDRPGHGVPGS